LHHSAPTAVYTLSLHDALPISRGAVDDKAEGAIWVDTLARFREENYRPLRTVKLALTCGEETSGALNGAQWLTQNRRDLIDAALDRKSTRLNSSHSQISYAVFC